MFVPKSKPLNIKDVEKLVNLIIKSDGEIVVLTGAGISTPSGIPDYRSENVGLYARFNHKPMNYQDFMKNSRVRQRYWTRNYCGYLRNKNIEPNKAHNIITKWYNSNIISKVITQNVDRLHTKSGLEYVIELHGALEDIICTNCNNFMTRHELQHEFNQINDKINFKIDNYLSQIAPDGDVILPDYLSKNFQIPTCKKCLNGILKPDVVFFGDNVKKNIKTQASKILEEAKLFLCIGTSLEVFSAFRLALQARDQRTAICIVNIGLTRADEFATLKIDSLITDVLSASDALIRY